MARKAHKAPKRSEQQRSVARNQAGYVSPLRPVAARERPIRRRHLTRADFALLRKRAESREAVWRWEGCALARARAVSWLVDEVDAIESGERRQASKQERRARRDVGGVSARQYAQFRHQAGISEDGPPLRGRERGVAIGRLIELVFAAGERNIYPIDHGRRHKKTKLTRGQRSRRRQWIDRSPEAEMLLEQKQKVTQHFKRGSKKDGELRGLAGALAEYVAPRALKAHGLGEEHEHRMQLFLRWRAEMLVSNWGMATYQRWLARPVGDAGGDDHLAFMLEDAAHELAATICPAAGLDGQERELTEYLTACFQRDASELGGYLAWRAHQARQEAA